jgi:predicted RND superfamily exporter protein
LDDPDIVRTAKMTITGPIPMTRAITERTYSEMSKVLPAALALVAASLMIFHRNIKIVIITGLPVMCALAITFGMLGLLDVVLTPQVTLVAPILVALGVAYGLYIANRYSEEKHPDKKERVTSAVRTTGKAVFLSALTTSIGFGSLMTVDMIPLRMLGLGLSMGIMICWAVTMLTVPSLVLWLNYEKRAKEAHLTKLARTPRRHRKKILVAALSITLISVALIPSVQANLDSMGMSPQDEPVVAKMNEYAAEFGGGQLGLVLAKGSPAIEDEEVFDYSLKDIRVLNQMNAFELAINGDPSVPGADGVQNARALGIVDIMKMVKVPDFTTSDEYQALLDLYEIGPGYGSAYVDSVIKNEIVNTSFWDVIHHNLIAESSTVQQSFISIFYNTLPGETRGMMVTEDYARTVVYIDMPTMDVVATEKSVDGVNEATMNNNNLPITITKLTGFGAIMVAVNNLLITNSLIATVIALALVFVVLAIVFRTPGTRWMESTRFSGMTVLPVVMVVLLQPLILRSISQLGVWIDPEQPYFLGDLNLFTALIGSIIVGIGIDFGIHMTERIREGGVTHPAVARAVETSGGSFIEATVTMLFGLSAVFVINIPAIREFILMIMILLTASMLAAILVLPAIYSVFINWKESKRSKSA